MIHLDTNFLIDALVPGSAQESQLIGWLEAGETLGISALAWGELLCGPLSATAETFVRQLLPDAKPLDRSDAEKAAQLFNHTGRRSKTYVDCCIAAAAIRVNATLATSNRDDFLPMVSYGLRVA
ncbi:MAG: PIN domain-containing protein [Prosthecobacter sp.]|uniref:type II toxin-antitoxin system VapC family toxin n=1 Tax=Prosthecobacter sp. TaxID=1965333 RepID=UPI0025D94687|nr:PIN domain-containing protein [Prosthecobacter sp.]MCF7786497.1 PIN domain-containing protein [Prosthecobacter sp.]